MESNGYLTTSLYSKPTAGNTVLKANSGHPKSLIRSIPFSQYLRARRLCSTEYDFETQASILQKRLLERGYSRSLLKKAYKNAQVLNRNNLLYNKKICKQDEMTRCIMTFSNQSNEIKGIFERFLFLLKEDPVLNMYLPLHPSITYRRSRSLKDTLVSSHFATDMTSDAGIVTFPCDSCQYCQYLDTRTNAILPNGIR